MVTQKVYLNLSDIHKLSFCTMSFMSFFCVYMCMCKRHPAFKKIHPMTFFPQSFLLIKHCICYLWLLNPLIQLDLRVSLVKLICKLLCVGKVVTQTNEVNLQLKWAICFVPQCKTNALHLKAHKQVLNLRYNEFAPQCSHNNIIKGNRRIND